MRLQSMLGALGVLGVLAAAGPDPVTAPVTFDREILPILQARCASCHSTGGPAPMPLTTYDEVRPWAGAIKAQVLARTMPKWAVAHGYGAFANDPSLTPAEMAAVTAWVNGGLPRGSGDSKGSAGSTRAVVASAFRRKSTPLSLPAAAAAATLRVTPRWIGGWDFQPGDSLITSATLTSADGAPIGTWVAGDGPVQLSDDAGLRVVPPIHVRVQRRAAAAYEQPFTQKRSRLWLLPRATAPTRRIWVEEVSCGAPRTGRAADLLAVRPLAADGTSARVWIERPGSPRTIVGWFRNIEALYPRTYWLARAADLPVESRVEADSACRVELTLAAR